MCSPALLLKEQGCFPKVWIKWWLSLITVQPFRIQNFIIILTIILTKVPPIGLSPHKDLATVSANHLEMIRLPFIWCIPIWRRTYRSLIGWIACITRFQDEKLILQFRFHPISIQYYIKPCIPSRSTSVWQLVIDRLLRTIPSTYSLLSLQDLIYIFHWLISNDMSFGIHSCSLRGSHIVGT
jgi:hypothetical protein